MKRFVSYLYSIYNNQKIHNAGFARMELRTGRNRVDIHLKENGYAGKTGTVYLFIRKQKNIQGISIGNITFRGSQADFRYEQAEENIGQTPWQIMQMNGILIMIDDRAAFLSQWDEQPVDTDRFEVWNIDKIKEEGVGEEQRKYGPDQKAADQMQSVHTENQPGIEHMDKLSPDLNHKTENEQIYKEDAGQKAQNTPCLTTARTTARSEGEKAPAAGRSEMEKGAAGQPKTEKGSASANQTEEGQVSTSAIQSEEDQVPASAKRTEEDQVPASANQTEEEQVPASAKRPEIQTGDKAAVSFAGQAEPDEALGSERQINIRTAELQPQSRNLWNQTWRYMLRMYPVLNQFADKNNVLCVRIEIKDLRLLPEKYWSMVNNSFLLHGFFNYRYLAFGRIDQNWFVGIPGIYQNQEHVMASIFGFPDFLPQKQKNERGEQPGYWYRILEI